jgi:ABC-type transport system involved in multi-copper enzyme maturation permease subunit
MRALLRSEYLKVRTTRTVFGLMAGLLVLVGLATFGTERSLDAATVEAGVAPELFITMAAAIVPIFALVLGIRSITDEFRSGAIVPTLLATPTRRQVVGAKLAVTAAVGALMGLAAAVAAAGLGSGLVALEEGSVLVVWGSIAALSVKVAAVAGAASVIGLGVGVLVRHQVAAIVGALLWFLVAENIADGLAPAVAKYLPVHAMNAIVAGSLGVTIGAGLAGAVLIGWAGLALAGGAAAFARRDVA